jgi:Putative Actinobacterial Holin-X, holin superfamily III
MSTDLDDRSDQSAASLVSGILDDLQDLVEQQFQLTRREIEEEICQRAAAGMGVLFLDAIVLSLTLVHLLHWVASPPGTDPAWLPLWACYAVLAAVLVVIGGVLMWVGRARFRSIDRAQNPVTEFLQENAPWTTPLK